LKENGEEQKCEEERLGENILDLRKGPRYKSWDAGRNEVPCPPILNSSSSGSEADMAHP
jgi:hypothetical protein